MNNHTFFYQNQYQSQRLDKTLSLLSGISRSQITQLVKKGKVLIDNILILDPAKIISYNCTIKIIEIITSTIESELVPKFMPIDVVHEDNHLLVINKSAGLTVHPGAGNYNDTLVNGLLYRYKDNLSSLNDQTRPGIVHRLDRETSGLMVVAKNNISHISLSEQISSRVAKRYYLCIVWGVPNKLEGQINTQITRSHRDRTKMTAICTGGKNAITNYSVKEVLANGLFSLIEAKLDTGRTHQIRVHMSHIGHSIVGDAVYGTNNRKAKSIIMEEIKLRILAMKRQALHAYYLGFNHPATNEVMEFEATPPEDFQELLLYLRNIDSDACKVVKRLRK